MNFILIGPHNTTCSSMNITIVIHIVVLMQITIRIVDEDYDVT